jgi:NAD-dependent dihydropyrimidine dehydrogenase PreA subunit
LTIERIDEHLCTGCGICVTSCPTDVIRLDESTQKAVIQYPEDCQLCGWCSLDCPQKAIFISPKKRSPTIACWG